MNNFPHIVQYDRIEILTVVKKCWYRQECAVKLLLPLCLTQVTGMVELISDRKPKMEAADHIPTKATTTIPFALETQIYY